MTLKGHHHISMVTKSAVENNRFNKEILGLRRVLMTVNQDSPDMYHLFFGDKTGAPGTELTYFEIPMAGRTHKGTNAISRIGLLVPTNDSLIYWEQRLNQFGVKNEGLVLYAGRTALQFEDHEELQFVMIANEANELQENWQAWEGSDVPEEHRILGMGPIELTVREPEKTITLLRAIFGYEVIEQKEDWVRIQTPEGKLFSEIILFQKDGPAEKAGRGSIHHLAIRALNDKQLNEWDEAIRARGLQTSGQVDRHYFQSVYFRDENNILFELATDEPGFIKDGDDRNLGVELELPPKLEANRDEIIARLKPLS